MNSPALFELSDPVSDDVLGIIGQRQLVAVQLFDIARHTSNPVAITPSSFVAVTGRGPRDSNESGKTSFNAAVSLLLGDPEWRASGGGVATVAQLLFEPDTAGVTATRYPAAQVGYIVGVFADSDDIAGTAHTVWMRIASNPKYLRIRHQPGVHLVEADTDALRHRKAREAWNALPSAEFGAGNYVENLYGRSPRCLAYVASRGNQRSGPSLLKMDTGAFRPADIGAALVRLTGRSEALDLEKEQRRKLADETAAAEANRLANEQKWAAEEETLNGVRTRTTVRTKLAEGNALWRKHLARGLLDAVARTDWLTTRIADVDENLKRERELLIQLKGKENSLKDVQTLKTAADAAKTAFDTADLNHQEALQAESRLKAAITALSSRMVELEQLGARDARLTVDEAEAGLARCRDERAVALANLKNADAEVARLQEELALAERGAWGSAARTLEVLSAHNIEAFGLMDAVEIADGHRDAWEPRLHPWRAAVCVTEGLDADRALEALAAVPGAIVVAGPPQVNRPLPTGLASAPGQALPLLAELAARMRPLESTDVKGVLDSALGATVVAGFPRPTTGRTHIIRSLQDRIIEAEAAQEEAHRLADSAKDDEREANTVLTAARSAVEHRKCADERRSIEREQLPEAQSLLVKLLDVRTKRFDVHTTAQTNLKNAQAALSRAVEVRQECEKRLSELNLKKAELKTSLDNVNVRYWRIEFGGDDTAARIALNWSDDVLEYLEKASACRPLAPRDLSAPAEIRTQDGLASAANRSLDQILAEMKIDRESGEGAPTPLIAEALQRAETITRRSASGRDTGYAGVADALQDWLSQLAERDELAVEQITALRAQRDREANYAMSTLASLTESLTNLQDNLEGRIEANIEAISEALNRLNQSAPDGFGAKLEHSVERPTGPDDPWVWQVVPMWRRSPGGRMLPYNNATNSAQEKLFSIHLVLAALLASPNPRGRVLILDELGDSLGEEHRRDVLSAVASVAEEHGITVLGTCQDAVMPDAATYCREILYFCYPLKSEALNLPTRMFGFDENSERVELTADALLAGRPIV